MAGMFAGTGLFASAASAGGGSSFSVSTTAAVSGSTVSGVLTLTNAESEPIPFSALSASIEVRFDEGVAIPPLPAGSSAGWYRIAQVSLPAPVTVAAGASQGFPFVIDPCSASLPNYRSAKDMRAFGSATAARVRDAYSDTFPLPTPCPVCGNAVLEAGEQCDAGASGGSCCTSTCQFRPSGTTCNDGNACTQVDACQAGICLGSSPVVCTAADACRVAGVCNPTTGVCSQPAKPNGAACDDQNACTGTDTCQAGVCRGSSPVVCPASGPCMNASCEPSTGACVEAPKPDGTTCSDASACTSGDQCEGGACTSGAPLVCNDAMSCTTDTCNVATGCSYSPATTCEACDATPVHRLQRALRDGELRLPGRMLGGLLELPRRLHVDVLRSVLPGRPRPMPRQLSDDGGLSERLRGRKRLRHRMLGRIGEPGRIAAGAFDLAHRTRGARSLHGAGRERRPVRRGSSEGVSASGRAPSGSGRAGGARSGSLWADAEIAVHTPYARPRFCRPPLNPDRPPIEHASHALVPVLMEGPRR
ncbi:MAG: hypothetical protein IPK00_26355 [Deltaproteobacteria bacterium]|nr:hypothetical protein [Deltaproteobacteria bacterium]